MFPVGLNTDDVLQDAHVTRRLKVVKNTSASQIQAWQTCPRYWFNQSVEGLRTDPAPHQRRGTAVDLQVQHYLKTGEIREQAVEVDTGKIEEWSELTRALAAHLPKPGPCLLIQERIDLVTYPGGPTCVGYPDLAYWITGIHLHVDDVKTTSDFDYCKSREELAQNVQMVTYARWGYETMGAEVVSIAHVYGRTRGAKRAHRSFRPHAHPCDCSTCKAWLSQVGRGQSVTDEPLVAGREQIEMEWGKITGMTREMVAAARGAARAEDLPPDTEKCSNMYGRPCPYRAKCGFSGGLLNIGGVKMTNQEGGLMARLLAKKAETEKAGTSVQHPLDAALQRRGVDVNGDSLPEDQTVREPSAPEKVVDDGAAVDADAEYQKVLKAVSNGEVRDAGGGHVFAREGADSGWILRAPTPLECRALGLRTTVGDVPTGVAFGVVPPDAPARESTPAEIAAVEEAVKRKRGRPKKVASEDETVTIRPPSSAEISQVVKIAEMTQEKLSAVQIPGKPVVAITMICELCGVKIPAANHDAHVATQHLSLQIPITKVETRHGPGLVDLPSSVTVAEARGEAWASLLEIVASKRKGDLKVPAEAPVLYVDCLPVKGAAQPTTLEEWLGPIAELAAAANEVEDYRLISYTAKGVLATAMRACLDSCPAALLIDSRAPGADVALEVLVPHAALVVRGIR